MTRQQQMEHLQRCCDDLNMLLERPTKMFNDPPGLEGLTVFSKDLKVALNASQSTMNVGHIHLESWGEDSRRYRVASTTAKGGSEVLFPHDGKQMAYPEALRVLKAAIKALELEILRRQIKAGV